MVERKRPVPASVAPVLAFVNSLDVELGTDEWADGPAAFTAWLVEAALVPASVRATPAEYRLALDLRAGLRAQALANNGVAASDEDTDRLARALRKLPLVVVPDEAVLAGIRETPVLAALARVAGGYAAARLTDEWTRLRQCPAGDCAWIFWDSSAKGARKWCTMGVCGNRAKVRAYASRRR